MPLEKNIYGEDVSKMSLNELANYTGYAKIHTSDEKIIKGRLLNGIPHGYCRVDFPQLARFFGKVRYNLIESGVLFSFRHEDEAIKVNTAIVIGKRAATYSNVSNAREQGESFGNLDRLLMDLMSSPLVPINQVNEMDSKRNAINKMVNFVFRHV